MALTFIKKKKFTGVQQAQTAEKTTGKLPYWEIEKHGVSQSMLMEFLACPERARLGYKEGLTSSTVSNAIVFGELFHSVMEGIYTHIKAGKAVDNRVYLENCCNFVLRDYKKRISTERLWTPEDEQNHQMNTGYLHIMVPAYIDNYLQKDVKQEWLIVEDEFQNTLSKLNFTNITLKGRYDQVYKNKHGEVWIKEMKTKWRIDPNIQYRLSYDFQALFYILNYWLEFNVMPNGFVYDIIQRPGLRQGKQENLEHFMARIKGEVDNTYFKRVNIRVTKDDLDKWLQRDFIPIIKDFYAWATGTRASFRNPASCETKYGMCKFARVCGLNEFTGLYRKEHGLLNTKI